MGDTGGVPHTISKRSEVEIHIHIHHHQDTLVHNKLDKIIATQGVVVAKVDELKAELEAANVTTNEIAADVTDLLNRLVEGGLTPAEAEEVKQQIMALNARLQGVAAQHTPTT